jgi:hypothetical protein
MANEASLDRTQRVVRVVREALDDALPNILREYYRGFSLSEAEWRQGKHGKAPDRLDLDDCAKHAVERFWGAAYGKLYLNGNRPQDAERVRHVFVVPGDDPDKVLTSYEVVRPDQGDGVLTIHTPVLPNGKRLEATYRAERLRLPDAKEVRTVVWANVREVE